MQVETTLVKFHKGFILLLLYLYVMLILDDAVRCPKCNKWLTRKNIKQHLKGREGMSSRQATKLMRQKVTKKMVRLSIYLY